MESAPIQLSAQSESEPGATVRAISERNRFGKQLYHTRQTLQSLRLAKLGKNIHPPSSLRMLCERSLKQAHGAGSGAAGQSFVGRFAQRPHRLLIVTGWRMQVMSRDRFGRIVLAAENKSGVAVCLPAGQGWHALGGRRSDRS